MSRAIKMGGAGGGSGSDDVTAAKAQLLENYTAITKDSDDEPGAGTMKHLTNRATVTHETANGTKVLVGDAAFMVTNSDGVHRAEIRYNGSDGYVTPNTLFAIPSGTMATAGGMTAAKVLAGQSAFGISGTATNDGTITADKVRNGYIAYSKGARIVGTEPDYTGTPNQITNLRINNGRIETAVNAGYHACYWAGNSYEYITYAQMASLLGLTGSKLIPGNTVCGVTSTATNWYNANNQQTVFNSGSFGLAAALGAYYATATNNIVSAIQDSPVVMTGDGGGIRFESSAYQRYVVFRASFPLSSKYVQFVLHRQDKTINTTATLYVASPADRRMKRVADFTSNYKNTYARTYDLTNYISDCTGGYYIIFDHCDPVGYNGGLRSLELSPTPF